MKRTDSRMEKNQVIRERLRRQRLVDPIESLNDGEQYKELFKLLQPVSPVHFSRPGDPPSLVHRTEFLDNFHAGNLRANNTIIKGRFCGGRVGYVLQEDLELYATVFRKPLSKLNAIHEEILSTLKKSGGLSKNQLKQELSNYPLSEISKALQSLQEAFLLYEHQPDTDWDTGWFDFVTEWYEIKADESRYMQSISQVIHSFIRSMVFATTANIRSWSQLPIKTIQKGIIMLQEEGKILAVEVVDLGKGYVCADDAEKLQSSEIPSCTFMLDKSDFLVRAHLDELQKRYNGYEVLQYLLIDGEFQGVVLGHWRIGPYDVEDILLELPADQAEARKREMIEAVTKIYSPGRHAILKYQGVSQ